MTIPPRWYAVDKDGMATLCVDEADARQNVAQADLDWPNNAPHVAVQLAPVQPAMPADADDTKRLDFLAEHARTVRRANDGRQNLIIWDYDYPTEGAGLRKNMNSMIDDARRRIEGES